MTDQGLTNLFDLKNIFLGETLVELAFLRYQALVPELATLKLAFAHAVALLERDVHVLQNLTALDAASLQQDLLERVQADERVFETAA